jgi:hypothetical protein
MFKKIIMSLVVLAGSAAGVQTLGLSTSHAQKVLTADQYNMLRIERKKLMVERERALNELLTNAKKMEIYLAWTSAEGDKKPDVLKDKLLPATYYVLGGTAASYVLFQKYFPEFLKRLPPKVQTIIKLTPALYAAVQAAFLTYNANEYSSYVAEVQAVAVRSQEMRSLNRAPSEDPLIAYYRYLRISSERLADEIAAYDHAIGEINRLVTMYE